MLYYHILYCTFLHFIFFLSQLGSDAFAQEYLEILRKENVDVSHVNIQKDKQSGIAHITVAEDGMS